jgi:hypothetical protein
MPPPAMTTGKEEVAVFMGDEGSRGRKLRQIISTLIICVAIISDLTNRVYPER